MAGYSSEPIDRTEGALGEVEALALSLFENGRFDSMAKARAYVFDSRPTLAKAVREQSEARARTGSTIKSVTPTGAKAEVEKQALRLLDAGAAPSLGVARGLVYEADPALAARVRAES